MNVLQEIAKNLKNQNEINEKVSEKLKEDVPAPDAKEEKKDAQRKKMNVLKKMSKFAKGIADKLILNDAKKFKDNFLKMLKNNSLMALGSVFAEVVLNNWDKFEAFFKGLGEILQGPIAEAINFFKTFTPNFVSAMKQIYGATGIVGVVVALRLLTRPVSTMIALVKATTMAVRSISVLFKGGKFLSGLLGKRGLGRLGLLAAIPLLAGGTVAASSEAVEQMPDMTESARAMALEGDYEGAAQLMSTFNEDNGGTMLPPGGLIKSPVQADYWKNWASQNPNYQPTATPTGPAGAPTPTLDTKGETPVAEKVSAPQSPMSSRLDSKGATPESVAPAVASEMSSRLDSKGFTPSTESANLSINPSSNTNITQGSNSTNLLQEIAYNTSVTPQKQQKKAEMLVKAIAEKWAVATESGLIENSFGTTYDDIGLSTMTA